MVTPPRMRRRFPFVDYSSERVLRLTFNEKVNEPMLWGSGLSYDECERRVMVAQDCRVADDANVVRNTGGAVPADLAGEMGSCSVEAATGIGSSNRMHDRV